MTKNIQDYLLPYLESGQVMLIGVTTENPIMSIVPAIRSRCQIFEFKALSDQNILTVLTTFPCHMITYNLYFQK